MKTLWEMKAGDDVRELNLHCKELGVGHLFVHHGEVREVLAAVLRIGEHLQTVAQFCDSQKLRGSEADALEAHACAIRASESLLEYAEYEDNYRSPGNEDWMREDAR